MLKKMNHITIAILASFLTTQSFAEEYNFDAEMSTAYGNSDYAVNDVNANLSIEPPKAPISQLPVVPKNVRENAQKTAFEQAAKNKQGLTPDMVREIKKNYQEKNKAINEVDLVSIPKSRTIPISLGVSEQKEVIRTSVKYATSISLVDSTGKPWNVENTVIGNGTDFTLTRLDGPNGHYFTLTANKEGARSNVIFLLKEGKSSQTKVSIVLDVVSGQKQVDDKLVLRVQGIGPNGSIEQTRLTQAIDAKYNNWLDGVIPASAKPLKSDDKFLKAWREVDGSIVVITKYIVFSPLSRVSLSSPDGDATLYKLVENNAVVWGRDPVTNEVKKIKITGF